MDFSLTEEQRLLKETVRDFAQTEIKPFALKWDKTGEFPSNVLKKAAQLGLMGIFIPTEYGGSGMDTVAYVLALEEICKADAGVGVIVSVNNSLVCDPIFHFGTEEQKKRYLIPLAKGEMLGCFALTESGAGSDPAGMATQAIKENDCYVLNGTKLFATNGAHAQVTITFAVTDKGSGSKGISAFIVERGMPGFSVTKEEDKMGIRSSDTAELVFENCRILKENLLGKEGDGLKIALATLDGGRIGIATQAIGIAQACLEESIKYSKERTQFGEPIANFQAIRWMLSDMSTEIEAARMLTFKAAYLKDKGVRYSREASEAKLYASEMANRVAYKAVQVFGGYGYIKDYPVEKYYRDVRVTTLYEGTSEIQRLVIARELLKD
ncbi:MAG TPA: acyl-CoA dehydrogenase [Candidatus Brocadiia bacterium]|nr:acyl-CoA dehydrogenase [Candidatus Brocadiales bacterium]